MQKKPHIVKSWEPCQQCGGTGREERARIVREEHRETWYHEDCPACGGSGETVCYSEEYEGAQ